MADASKPAQQFIDLAERIDRNRPEDFAGAYLIVPPNGGEPISGIFIGPSDLPAFLAFVKSKVEIAHQELIERERNQVAFRR